MKLTKNYFVYYYFIFILTASWKFFKTVLKLKLESSSIFQERVGSNNHWLDF